MKVLQLLPTLAMGDAIGNDVRALDKVIRGMGYQTGIYAEVIDVDDDASTVAIITMYQCIEQCFTQSSFRVIRNLNSFQSLECGSSAIA